MATRRKNQEEESEVTETVVEVKPTWKVISGGITLLNKKSYTKGDTFQAEDWEVPKSVRDIVKCVTPELVVQRSARTQLKYSLREVVPTAEEMDEEGYVQLYDIVNSNGKAISETDYTKEEGDKLVKELNR